MYGWKKFTITVYTVILNVYPDLHYRRECITTVIIGSLCGKEIEQ